MGGAAGRGHHQHRSSFSAQQSPHGTVPARGADTPGAPRSGHGSECVRIIPAAGTRHEDGHITQLDLSGRVRAALSSEPAVTAVAQAGKGWFKPVLGAALAASVAVMAVLTVSKDNSPGAGLAAVERTETELTQPFASPNIGRMTPVSQPVNLSGSSPQAKAKMNTYLLRHYQLTGESGGKGFVSFVPIVVTQEPAKGGTELENGEKDGEPSQK